MKRRDVIKGAAFGATAIGLSGGISAAPQDGPFSLPTATFKKAAQHEFPATAFQADLPVPLVPRPTAIGTWQELMSGEKAKTVFGRGDKTPIGECFHGVAREWMETPPQWAPYGCTPTVDVDSAGASDDDLRQRNVASGWTSWQDKVKHFGRMLRFDAETGEANAYLRNWGGGVSDNEAVSLPIKCYKVPVLEVFKQLPGLRYPTRFYGYAGMVPGPMLKMRLGQPVVVRYENHLEAELSIHLHGGHSPSHSDGFPSFYVLQGKARDYFYPNMLPLYKETGHGQYTPDLGESQSTMWYHDHAMDATAYNVSKGLAGVAPCFGEEELGLINDGVLPGLRKDSCIDPEQMGFVEFKDEHGNPVSPEDPENPGFYKKAKGIEPYFNPYDIPLVLQDRVFDVETGQIAYDNTGHNGYIGETMVVNGTPWPKLEVEARKYRFRILDGSNARVFRLRLMSAEKFLAANKNGIDVVPLNFRLPEHGPTPPLLQPQSILPVVDENAEAVVKARPSRYDAASENYLRIGKDSWLWSHAAQMKSIVLMMANRADIVVDFGALCPGLKAGETKEFYLVNTMPQFDGRGPKSRLENGGDPRVLPVPFDVAGVPGVDDLRLVETNRPIPLVKFVVTGPPVDPKDDASVCDGTPLIKTHRKIEDSEIRAVREFIFERGKGAWQINGRFYDPTIANATPVLDGAEEWVLRNGGGGWWHPIHIHLESHELVSYEKDFGADAVIDRADAPPASPLLNRVDIAAALPPAERTGHHDTQALGPNTVARIRMRHRTWNGPFVFHCHNLEHEDMRMMYNFEPVQEREAPSDRPPNIVPDSRTHGNDVTFQGRFVKGQDGKLIQEQRYIGELEWEYPPVPQTPVTDSGEDLIPPRTRSTP